MNHPAAWLPIAALCGLSGCTHPASPITASKAGPAADGAQLYDGSCLSCHQQDARGIKGVYPSLVDSPVLLGDPAELSLWVIKGQRPLSMPAGRYSTIMLQFGWMKPGDAAVLFTYLRSHFGNSAPAIDAATVAQALGQSP